MGLFSKKTDEEATVEDLSEKLGKSEEKREFFLLSIRAMLQLLKEFALDQNEINSKGYKKQIDRIQKKFVEEKEVRPIRSLFDKSKQAILSFISNQKRYIKEREDELRDIIDLMSTAMVTLNTENQAYHGNIYKQSEKIEKITLLDDIRKIRNALETEVSQMRKFIREKQTREEKRMKTLTLKVDALNDELKKAKEEASTDGLTGVFNRLTFDRYIQDLVEKNTVKKTPFAMLIIDIDDFKKVNDAYGHQTGDSILVSMTRKCKEAIRGDDFLGRYGGEEFVVLLPGASLKNAIKKGRQICKIVAATKYKYVVNDEDAGITLRVTVSIGVSAYRKGDTVGSVIERADKALYLAKESGKNCVISEKNIK
ncbi:MAG: diguanylate cyclase [Desulfobacterales bacterium]|nr:diguanylate cyclase [Desulfobacterales bacterium]